MPSYLSIVCCTFIPAEKMADVMSEQMLDIENLEAS